MQSSAIGAASLLDVIPAPAIKQITVKAKVSLYIVLLFIIVVLLCAGMNRQVVLSESLRTTMAPPTFLSVAHSEAAPLTTALTFRTVDVSRIDRDDVNCAYLSIVRILVPSAAGVI